MIIKLYLENFGLIKEWKYGCMIFVLSIYICNVNAQNRKWEFYTDAIFRRANLNWSIAGNIDGNSPNILSELHFNNINALGTNIRVNYNSFKRLFFFMSYQNLWTIAGRGIDSDYNSDNRMNPTYHEEFSSHKGKMNFGSLGWGYHFYLKKNVGIIAGLSVQKYHQEFFLLNENLPTLNSEYEANSNSLGFFLSGYYRLNRKFKLESIVTSSFLHYHSKANWNMIDIFEHPLSFSQKANGYGLNSEINIKYLLCSSLNIHLGCFIEKKYSKNGKDVSYLKDKTTRITKFNGANLHSKAILVGFSYLL